MVYTETEKRRLDNIYNAFSGFIKRQDYFDILYSEKVGYVKLWVKQSIIESPSVFTTAEEMMEALCYEVIFSQNNPSHHLTAEAEAKSRSLLISITMQMEENREYYRDYAEKYVQEFREKYDED